MRKISIFSSLLVTLLAVEAKAENCYRFVSSDSAENLPIVTSEELFASSQAHTWCYEEIVNNGKNFVYAYSADEGKIDPALVALTEFDKKGEIVSVTHGSLYKGEISFVHSELKGFNPLSRPLDRVSAALQGESVVVTLDADSAKSRASLFNKLSKKMNEPSSLLKIVEGTLEKKIPTEKYPYAAYWWPHSGLPLIGPLTKYDEIVKKWTGTDPKSREWESQYHSLQHVDWGGHCNGWAASSVLYKEVDGVRTEPQTGISLSTSDFNGILAEASFCVDWAFFGKRNNGQAGDDPRDIAPNRFHEVMLHYIGKLGKPVAMDYVQGASVDNHVASGYKFTVTKDSSTANTYNVVADIQMHGYDSGRYDVANDVAYTYTRSYTYKLTTDSAGNITGGTWTSYSNPDFLWVPLAQKKCGRENPRIDTALVTKMMNLPANSSLSVGE